MSKSNFSLKRFQAEVRKRGLAKQNRFEIVFPTPAGLRTVFPDTQIVNMFCESTSLPPQNISVRTQRIYGPVYQRPVSADYGGEGITMTFLLDQQMDIKALFDAWLGIVVDPKQYFVHYQNDYVVPIEIRQLNENDEVTYSAELEDAFPRNYTLLELNQGATNSFHKLSVTFVYRRWAPKHRITNNIKYSDIKASITPLVGTAPNPEYGLEKEPGWYSATSVDAPKPAPEIAVNGF
jgi:hypothetical protein